jgi:nucleoside-diphosphate-sugar epimerase
MRILVTGAEGIIGSHVARALLRSGHEVIALVRPATPIDRLGDVADRLTVVRGSLENDGLVEALRRAQPEGCIHLAWYAQPGTYLEAPENVACLHASLRLLESLATAGCRHVVMAGTCAEYDTDLGYLREDGPTAPRTIYAASKLALSLVAAARAAQLGIGFAWARLFYLYGPHEDPRRLVPSLITALLDGKPFDASPGGQVRDFLHVADVAAAFTALAEGGAQGIFNVCSGEPITMRQLMSLVGDIVGRGDLLRFGAVPYRAWDPAFICGDNRRLRTQTGWVPRHPLPQGLAATVEWWKTHRAGERAA